METLFIWQHKVYCRHNQPLRARDLFYRKVWYYALQIEKCATKVDLDCILAESQYSISVSQIANFFFRKHLDHRNVIYVHHVPSKKGSLKLPIAQQNNISDPQPEAQIQAKIRTCFSLQHCKTILFLVTISDCSVIGVRVTKHRRLCKNRRVLHVLDDFLHLTDDDNDDDDDENNQTTFFFYYHTTNAKTNRSLIIACALTPTC